MTDERNTIVRNAIEIRQVPDHPLYLFTLSASEILELADISRVARDQTWELIGYQRQDVPSHIREIAEYLDGQGPLFPNAIILALRQPPAVRFKSKRGPDPKDDLQVTAGTLEIRRPATGGQRPAWIVDGQQRAFALSQAKNRHFPVPVSGFVAPSIAMQRDQFIRVNNAKPLPRRLIDELLPVITSPLEPRLAARQLPSKIVDELNSHSTSPFQGLIIRASTTRQVARKAVVHDKALTDTIQESLKSGCLLVYKDLDGQYDTDAVWNVLIIYWSAVRDTFPEAWGRRPTESRLMHQAGIRAMGRLMDTMMSNVNVAGPNAPKVVREGLERIKPYCRWTSGTWESLGLRWDEIQVLPRHISQLSQYLVRRYVLGAAER
jgi:DGQHR domain-containing protein